jgi:hypothetical protein
VVKSHEITIKSPFFIVVPHLSTSTFPSGPGKSIQGDGSSHFFLLEGGVYEFLVPRALGKNRCFPDEIMGDMSYGQYSWLITIKNGASHPMVHRDL